MVIPYAVELGVTVREHSQNRSELRGLSVQKGYFLFEEWHVLGREYQIENKTEKSQTVLIEHPHTPAYDLFDSPTPKERAAEFLRFEVTCAPRTTEHLLLFERRLLTRCEEVRKHNLSALKNEADEATLRARYIQKLNDSENQLETLAAEESREKSAVAALEQHAAAMLATLG